MTESYCPSMKYCSYQHGDPHSTGFSSNSENDTRSSNCCCYSNYNNCSCDHLNDDFCCDSCIENCTDRFCGHCSENTRENISTVIIYCVLMALYIFFIYVVIKIIHFLYKSSHIWKITLT
jgi:hypothetical protein